MKTKVLFQKNSIPHKYCGRAASFVLDREAVKYDEAGNVLLKLGEEELSIGSFGYGCVFVKYFVSGIHKSGF